MYHSITFGEKNTWDDWHLVPTSRPVFNPPAQKVKTLDIPGGDGLIDLSQSLTGYPVYQNRTGSFEFIVPNGFEPWEAGQIERAPWHVVYSDIMDCLHGRFMRAVLEDDPEYFYEGRFTVNAWKSEKDWSRIVIDYSVAPYKRTLRSSIDPWPWDPFNFQNGVILPVLFKDISVDEMPTRHIFPQWVFGRTPICPVFHVQTTAGRGVKARAVNPHLGLDNTRLIPDGANGIPEFVFYGEGNAELWLSCGEGTGSVSMEFRPGRL